MKPRVCIGLLSGLLLLLVISTPCSKALPIRLGGGGSDDEAPIDAGEECASCEEEEKALSAEELAREEHERDSEEDEEEDALDAFFGKDEEDKPLYPAVFPILHLDASNFSATLKCGTVRSPECTAFVVQFYSAESEYMRAYARVYQVYSVVTATWSSVLRIATVNCDLTSNSALCARHGFQSSAWDNEPVFVYFRRGADTSGQKLADPSTAKDLLDSTIDALNSEYRAMRYSDWPRFDYLPPITDLNQLDHALSAPIYGVVSHDAEELWERRNAFFDRLRGTFPGADAYKTLIIYTNDTHDFFTITLLVRLTRESPGVPVRLVPKGHLLDQVRTAPYYPAIFELTLSSSIGCKSSDPKDEAALKRALNISNEAGPLVGQRQITNVVHNAGNQLVVCESAKAVKKANEKKAAEQAARRPYYPPGSQYSPSNNRLPPLPPPATTTTSTTTTTTINPRIAEVHQILAGIDARLEEMYREMRPKIKAQIAGEREDEEKRQRLQAALEHWDARFGIRDEKRKRKKK